MKSQLKRAGPTPTNWAKIIKTNKQGVQIGTYKILRPFRILILSANDRSMDNCNLSQTRDQHSDLSCIGRTHPKMNR